MSSALKNILCDFALCLAISGSASITVQAGFNTDSSVAAAAITVLVCALLLVVSFAAGRKGNNVFLTLGMYLLASAVVVAVAAVTSSSALLEDTADNNLIPALVNIVVTGLVYALTRRLATSVVMFVVGFFACALIQFLYLEYHLVADAVFLLSSLAMIAFRNFATSLTSASTAAKATFTTGLISSVSFALVIMLLSGGVYAAVVAPLNPPAATLKLIQEYRKLPEIHARDQVEISSQIDERISSSEYDDEMANTTYIKPGEEGTEVRVQGNSAPNHDDSTLSGVHTSINPEGEDESTDLSAVGSKYNLPLIPIIIALIILLIVGSILLKLWSRKHWYNKICKADARLQVKGMYLYFLRRFEKLGIKKSPVQTPKEYVYANEVLLDSFSQVGEACFTSMTKTFTDVTYGGAVPSERQLAQFHRYYSDFYSNCKKYLGRFKYLIKFFSL